MGVGHFSLSDNVQLLPIIPDYCGNGIIVSSTTTGAGDYEKAGIISFDCPVVLLKLSAIRCLALDTPFLTVDIL